MILARWSMDARFAHERTVLGIEWRSHPARHMPSLFLIDRLLTAPSRMDISAFLKKLNDAPDSIAFSDTMSVIDTAYAFTPAAFSNGGLRNEAGQNSGSCKLFAFALLNQLSEQQTLACFGAYYRDDVLQHPDANDHQNIRNFMKTGWAGVKFENMPLVAK